MKMLMEFYTGTRKQFTPGGCVLLYLLGPFREANRLGLVLWVLCFRRTNHQLVSNIIAFQSCYYYHILLYSLKK